MTVLKSNLDLTHLINTVVLRDTSKDQKPPYGPTPPNFPPLEAVPSSDTKGSSPTTLNSARSLSRSSSSRSRSSRRNKASRPGTFLLYGIRLLVLGIGVGVIAGSLLSAWNPATRATVDAASTGNASSVTQAKTKSNSSSTPLPVEMKLGEELTALKADIQNLATKNPGLTPGMFFIDLDSGAYVDINGEVSFATASMIKVPILVAFLQDVDAGKIRLDEILTMRPDLIASGSGTMQYRNPGTQFTALETATKMIIISDNTATNMLIDRLGGIAAVNQRFQSWGLTATVIHNWLPDLEGTNVTKPKELASLMARVVQGDLLSIRARDRFLDIMQHTETDTLLPRGIDDTATISHKTGDIGTMVGDVGVIDTPSGKRYVAVAMVKRPFNDSRAQEMIRRISRLAYRTYNPPTPSAAPATPRTSPSPSP